MYEVLLNILDQTRRDDMESLVYMLIDILGYELPWESFCIVKSREDLFNYINKRCELERSTTLQFRFEHVPEFLIKMLLTIRKTGFYDAPDYEKLMEILIEEA
jgi:hypothetical protein